MSKFKGSLIFISGILIIGFEIYALIATKIMDQSGFTIQYVGLIVPLLILSLTVGGVIAWVGYTMIVTKEPILLSYEEAYEEAINAQPNNNQT